MNEVEIILAAYHEDANWARHYDAIRLSVTSLLLTLAGATGSAVLALSDNRRGQLGICGALICVGAVLTALSAFYLVEYHRVSSGSGKLLKLAAEYSQTEEMEFCHLKIRKKRIQGFFERFNRPTPDSVARLGCNSISIESSRALEMNPGFEAYLRKTLESSWFWLNLIVGIVFPAVLIVLVLLGVFGSAPRSQSKSKRP